MKCRKWCAKSKREENTWWEKHKPRLRHMKTHNSMLNFLVLSLFLFFFLSFCLCVSVFVHFTFLQHPQSSFIFSSSDFFSFSYWISLASPHRLHFQSLELENSCSFFSRVLGYTFCFHFK